MTEESEGVLQMVDFFKKAKEDVINSGYQWEISICDNRYFFKMTPLHFMREYAWVVINAGMKNQVAEKIYKRLWSEGVDSIGHLGKRKAIKEMMSDIPELHMKTYEAIFNKLKTGTTDKEKIDFLENLSWIGKITKFHLARNLGIDCAKPDRHLERLAMRFGFLDTDDMCEYISKKTGERKGTVDVILWRYCNLHVKEIRDEKK